MKTQILKRPWFIAILALVSMIGTQAVALLLYWEEIFPSRKGSVVLVQREQPSALVWGFSSEEISSLELELKTRMAALAARETDLGAYEARLAADRAEIEGIKAQVERMREELFEEVVRLEASEQKNLRTLSRTYANLTPDAAVSIFRELDDATVVKILFYMKNDTVGAILQEMATAGGAPAEQVRRAARLSDLLRLFSDNSQNELQPNI